MGEFVQNCRDRQRAEGIDDMFGVPPLGGQKSKQHPLKRELRTSPTASSSRLRFTCAADLKGRYYVEALDDFPPGVAERT